MTLNTAIDPSLALHEESFSPDFGTSLCIYNEVFVYMHKCYLQASDGALLEREREIGRCEDE